jgi:sugar phosphate permease
MKNNQADKPISPPGTDSFRRIVWPLALAQTLVWAAMYYSFPALLLAWERDLGWTKAELSGAFTVALVTSAFLAPMVGRIIDRGYGTHIFTGSALLGAVCLVVLSRVTAIWQFYAVWIMLGVAMAGSLYEACFAVLTHHCSHTGGGLRGHALFSR